MTVILRASLYPFRSPGSLEAECGLPPGIGRNSIPFLIASSSFCFFMRHAYPGPTPPPAQIFPTFTACLGHLLWEALQVASAQPRDHLVGTYRTSQVIPYLALSTKLFHLCCSSLPKEIITFSRARIMSHKNNLLKRKLDPVTPLLKSFQGKPGHCLGLKATFLRLHDVAAAHPPALL